MRSLSDTLARLSKLRSQHHHNSPQLAQLTEIAGFGSNPGALEARIHIPTDLAERPGLVVVLHGCTQTATVYDDGSGWSRLADEYGFVVLYPQQTRQNNPNTCFNWFVPSHTRRGEGEACSIRQMIDATVTRHHIDSARIFVTGLSAGGAMANVMLATYPELFAGGAIIAGLPYGCAGTIPEAFDRMRGHGLPGPSALQDHLRRASDHKGPWPVISVWHGSDDRTVVPVNGDAVVTQWQAVHEVVSREANVERREGHTVSTWKDRDGATVIEHITIAGMGHGTPIDGAADYGRSAPYMLDVGISSTLHSARTWGLIPSFDKRMPKSVGFALGKPPTPGQPTSAPMGSHGLQKIIEDALRSARLMK